MSEIKIGTVNFGGSYGIVNKIQLKKEEISKILNFCLRKKILNFDTSPSYGMAEKILGNFIKKNNARFFNITTKTPIDLYKYNSPEKYILKVFDQSLKNLNIEKIETLLVHNVDDFLSIKNEPILKIFENLKKEGKVKKIGVSIYNDKQYYLIEQLFQPDVVQLPISLFDQRTLKNGFLEKIKIKNCEIQARSIFLQGILLADEESIPQKFVEFRDGISKIKSLCIKKKITKLEVVLGFLNSISLIDYKVVGINSLKQLEQIFFLNNKTETIQSINFDSYAIKKTRFLDARNW
jgi:aryl-alcohol dehydrogenase-like predicted oxidoreductase